MAYIMNNKVPLKEKEKVMLFS